MLASPKRPIQAVSRLAKISAKAPFILIAFVFFSASGIAMASDMATFIKDDDSYRLIRNLELNEPDAQPVSVFCLDGRAVLTVDNLRMESSRSGNDAAIRYNSAHAAVRLPPAIGQKLNKVCTMIANGSNATATLTELMAQLQFEHGKDAIDKQP
jgi:hypothetical protein